MYRKREKKFRQMKQPETTFIGNKIKQTFSLQHIYSSTASSKTPPSPELF